MQFGEEWNWRWGWEREWHKVANIRRDARVTSLLSFPNRIRHLWAGRRKYWTLGGCCHHFLAMSPSSVLPISMSRRICFMGITCNVVVSHDMLLTRLQTGILKWYCGNDTQVEIPMEGRRCQIFQSWDVVIGAAVSCLPFQFLVIWRNLSTIISAGLNREP